jgi:hypothetical protein
VLKAGLNLSSNVSIIITIRCVAACYALLPCLRCTVLRAALSAAGRQEQEHYKMSKHSLKFGEVAMKVVTTEELPSSTGNECVSKTLFRH